MGVVTQADALAAVMTSPAQETEAARLVYADLLSDSGDPQGEFIVVQCQLAQFERQGQTGSPQYAQLKHRECAAEQRLRQRRAHLWDAGIVWRKFDRGFVTRLEVRKAEAVELLSQLQHDPFFIAVSRLEISEGTPAAIAQLTRVEGLTSLRTLRVARTYATHGFGTEGAEALAHWPVLKHVVDLRIRNEQVEDAGLSALLTSPNARSLKRLTVGHNAAGLREVFSVSNWPALAALELSCCRLTPAEVEQLVSLRQLRGLTSLSLSANHLGDEGARVLAASGLGLRELDLGSTGLTDSGLGEVAERNPTRLDKLVLSGAEVGPSVLRMARKHRALQTLMLNETQVDDQHVITMCSLLDGSLERLSLQGTSVTARSVEALRGCPKLRALSLARTDIGNAGAKVLANSPTFASLEQLDLDACAIDAEGCQALLDSPSLSRTLDISLPTTALPEHLIRAVRSRFAFS